MNHHILVIDDEDIFLRSVRRVLRNCGYRHITIESDPENALALIESGTVVDVALIDVSMPRLNGLEVLADIKSMSPQTECIMVTALNEADVAVKCLKSGAFDYLVKPVTQENIELCLRNAVERRRYLEIFHLHKAHQVPELNNRDAFQDIITQSGKMLRLIKEAEIHAASDVPVLITGESGTGKELLAKAVHQASPRRNAAYTAINMASLTPSIFDAEFFGYVKGAFTGADRDRSGYLEHTDGGTLFLDEIGIMPLELQGKLLRVLQSGEYLKLGSNRLQTTDIRLIASTNEDLDALIQAGKFRKDLYYRLNGAWLHLPPLRARKEDIPILVHAFVNEFQTSRPEPMDLEAVMAHLLDYDYPGNIRELRSIVQSAVNLAQGGPLTGMHLPQHVRKDVTIDVPFLETHPPAIMPLAQAEKELILRVYRYTGGNKSRSARILGVALNTLRKKLSAYGVD